jgi:hypothetical protein
MRIDLAMIIALAAIGIGVYLLFSRSNGGGGSPVAIPSQPVPGGWLPGGVSTGYRNGGIGAATPNVWAN